MLINNIRKLIRFNDFFLNSYLFVLMRGAREAKTRGPEKGVITSRLAHFESPFWMSIVRGLEANLRHFPVFFHSLLGKQIKMATKPE